MKDHKCFMDDDCAFDAIWGYKCMIAFPQEFRHFITDIRPIDEKEEELRQWYRKQKSAGFP